MEGRMKVVLTEMRSTLITSLAKYLIVSTLLKSRYEEFGRQRVGLKISGGG